MDEAKLIGWLVFYRHQHSNGAPRLFLPTCVHEAFVARGWLEVADEVDWQGDYQARITDAGAALSDLSAAEWGVNPIPEEAEA